MKADLELVREVKEGNRVAFAELVQRHQKTMMRVALRMVRDWDGAEDVVQESFIKAYQGMGSFAERSSFRSWLYQITLNTAKNRLRSHKREHVGLDHVTMATSADSEKRMIADDVHSLLRAEVDKLPERQRMALSLRIFDDLSFKEIAHIMECPYDTAKANYRHALMKLKSKMEVELKNFNINSDGPAMWIEFGAQSMEVEG